MWFWRRLLRIPWTARRSNQSILKEISPENSLEWLMLKLKLHTLATWCEEPTHLKRPWCWERLKVGEEGDNRGWDGWMVSPTQWTWVWVNYGSWWWTGGPGMLQSMGSQKVILLAFVSIILFKIKMRCQVKKRRHNQAIFSAVPRLLHRTIKRADEIWGAMELKVPKTIKVNLAGKNKKSWLCLKQM